MGKAIEQTIGKYLVALPPIEVKGRKTKIWEIRGTGNKAALGQIYWHSHWRCYAFFPERFTIFNAECMLDLSKFLQDETEKQKAGWKSKRSQ